MEQCILIAAAFLKRTKRDGAAREGGLEERGGRKERGVSNLTPPRWCGGTDSRTCCAPLTPSAAGLGGSEGRVRPRELKADGLGTSLPEQGCEKCIPRPGTASP